MYRKLLILLFLAGGLLAGCGGSLPTVPLMATETLPPVPTVPSLPLLAAGEDLPEQPPTDSPAPTLTPTFLPTATIFPTATALPTATAEPAATALPPATAEPAATALPTATDEPVGNVSPPTAAPTQPASLTYQVPVNTGPTYFPDGFNPLTGLELVNPSRLERRPIAIKITNFPRRVRPQSGLMLADIVYEYYIERGLTRFIAVFYGNDAKQVGPIRSGRFFDEHIVRMYDAIFAFANADKRVMDTWVQSDLVGRLVVEQTSNCPPMCRDKTNKDYNNLYTDTYLLSHYVDRAAENRRYDQSGMRFESLVPWGGQPAQDLYLKYSGLDYNHWLYNPDTGRYERFQETQDLTKGEKYAPHIDQLTGEQISTANLIVIRVEHEYFVNTSTTEIIQINLQGSGDAYIFRDGQVFEAKWRRNGVEDPLAFYRPSGATVFPLKPGNTFIQVIGKNSEMQFQGDIWRFDFEIP